MIEAVVFDLDGVLIDSEPVWEPGLRPAGPSAWPVRPRARSSRPCSRRLAGALAVTSLVLPSLAELTPAAVAALA